MDQNPSPPEYSAAKPTEAGAGNPIGSPAKQEFNGRALLKELALWFLRMPANVCFEIKRYLGIAVLKTRIQMTRRMNLKWSYETLGRVAYEKQITPDTFSAQYAEIKKAEGKLAEKRQPGTSGENPTFKTKAAQKFKNLVRWFQSLPLARRLNRLLVRFGKTISADEAVGSQFFTEWANLTTLRTRMAALKARCKAAAEHIPSQTDFSWWPRTITGILILLAVFGVALWQPEQRLYRLALAFFVISGTRYLWFSLTVPKEKRPKLKWWMTPGALSAFACVLLVTYGGHDQDAPKIAPNVSERKTGTPKNAELAKANAQPLVVRATPIAANFATQLPPLLAKATKDKPFINTLGQEFVPVPGTQVLFCRWETRVKDFEAYVKDTGYKQEGDVYVMKMVKQEDGTLRRSWEWDKKASWQKPGFEQGRSHPVVGVNWNEAREFCAWLSKKEGVEYRLPTDDEWSAAVGLGKFPWGTEFPPVKDAGNYAEKTFLKSVPGLTGPLKDYDDGAARTAPVASYAANRLGIFDLGGNVWELCEDEYKASMADFDEGILETEKASDGTAFRVLRGASWNSHVPLILRSSFRDCVQPWYRDDSIGFRCVLVVSGR